MLQFLTDAVRDSSGRTYPVLRAAVTLPTAQVDSGTLTIVAAVTGKKVRVLWIALNSVGGDCTLQSASTPIAPLLAAGDNLAFNPCGYVETVAGEALVGVNAGTSVETGVFVGYILI